MERLKTPDRGGVAALAGALAVALLLPVWVLHEEETPPPASRPLAVTPVRLPRPYDVAIAEARPLFAPDRTPAPAEDEASADPAAPPAPPPALLGVVLHGRASVALARSADGNTVMLRVGGTVDGWQLVAVTAAGATFALGERRETVVLQFGKSRQPSASAGAASSPSPPSPPPSLPGADHVPAAGSPDINAGA